MNNEDILAQGREQIENYHAGKYEGKTALIVLGGYSAADWKRVYDDVRPDLLLIANGANSMIKNADYWMCMENMHFSEGHAKQGEPKYVEQMEMFKRKGGRTNFVCYLSWDMIEDNSDCICSKRLGDGNRLEELPPNFSLREYGDGFMSGWLLKHKDAGALVHVGTVGTHMLHLAGILGCSEVHTIGYDLMFRDGFDNHHWYQYPTYEVDRFRKPGMFIEYKGARTQWAWAESAQFLKSIEWMFERDELKWIDHSNGLLTLEGLECAKCQV